MGKEEHIVESTFINPIPYGLFNKPKLTLTEMVRIQKHN